jgi:arginine decarboxylase
VWAIDQVFPIVPIARLDEEPDRRGVIADLTCDSDGRVDDYVVAEAIDSSLPLHTPRAGETYRLGIFLVGAYQEVLGDIHNLFGDTDAANVAVRDDGTHELTRLRRGDTTDVMLDYVGYSLDALRAAYEAKVDALADIPNREREMLYAALEAGLTGYTYLHETPFE